MSPFKDFYNFVVIDVASAVQVAADINSNFILSLQVRIFLFKNFKQGMIGLD